MTSSEAGSGPLSPHVFEILISLAEGPMHGYGIIQDIEERTEGRVSLSTSTLYGGVRKLVTQGLVEDLGKRPEADSGGPTRRYYGITAAGLESARAEARRVRAQARAASERLLRPAED